MTTATYLISDARVGEAREKLAKLAKRAAKLGVPAPVFTLGAEVSKEIFRTDRVGAHGEHLSYEPKRFELFREIELTSEPVVLGGEWTLLGTVHPTAEGNIIGAVPCATIPAIYRTRDGRTCDHCDVMRNRAETHIVQNAAGETKQVGSSCIRDFLSGHDAHAIANAMQWARALAAFADELEGFASGSGSPASSLEEVLTLAAFVVRSTGWRSSSAARNDEHGAPATASHVSMFLSSYNNTERDKYVAKHGRPTDADRETAEKAITWALETFAADDATPDNDYLANLRVVVRLGRVRGKFLGLAVSLISAHARAMEQALKLADVAQSAYVGTVGKREIFTLTVRSSHLYENDYGVTDIIEFTDAAGNLVVWRASTAQGLKQGDIVTGKATVKAHQAYRGIRQTMLSRFTIATPVGG